MDSNSVGLGLSRKNLDYKSDDHDTPRNVDENAKDATDINVSVSLYIPSADCIKPIRRI